MPEGVHKPGSVISCPCYQKQAHAEPGGLCRLWRMTWARRRASWLVRRSATTDRIPELAGQPGSARSDAPKPSPGTPAKTLLPALKELAMGMGAQHDLVKEMVAAIQVSSASAHASASRCILLDSIRPAAALHVLLMTMGVFQRCQVTGRAPGCIPRGATGLTYTTAAALAMRHQPALLQAQ